MTRIEMSSIADNSASPQSASVEDVQGRADTRRIAIDRVGIRNIRHPIKLRDRSGVQQQSVASFEMYVDLPHDLKGTHMSRFVELLHGIDELSVERFGLLLAQMTERLEAERGFITVRFPLFVTKRAPVSGVTSLMDYEVTLIGERALKHNRISLQVVVPVTSLCPCSKKISERGAHNQRSHITLTAEVREPVWIEDLIDIAEQEASCELYGILKRPDEKFVTEKAYDNPKFVEDLVRDLALRLQNDPRIEQFVVEAENFESIHNHSAYARIERRRDDQLPK
jgi:GTP cyclohydrolase I